MADNAMDINAKPEQDISVRDVFGIDTDMVVKGFADRTERVPEEDSTYKFDPDTTLAILAGFNHNRRVMIQGYHGTGKSTHIEQVASRLNWPCCSCEPGQPYLSYRFDRQRRDQIERRQAGHRFPRRHPAMGAAQPNCDRVR